MADALPLALHLALTVLRKRRGWQGIDLARAAHVSPTIVSYYENGRRPLSQETLLKLAQVMGYSAADVEALLFGLEAIAGRPVGTPGLSAEVVHEIRLEAIELGRREEGRLIGEAQVAAIERARAEADRWVREIAALPRDRRRSAVEARKELHGWAGVERMAHESERSAVNDPWQAIDWAELTLCAAGEVWEEKERKRLLGYAWSYLANARRVTSDLRGAEEAFVAAWRLWKAGRKAAWCPVEEWRIFDLEASLRRGQRDFRRAMLLHRRVLTAVPSKHRGRALLKMAKTYEAEGDLGRAIPCLQEAEPFVDSAREPRLRLVYRLNLAGCLALCGRFSEAEDLMPESRTLAIQLRNGVDLTRTLWIESWIHLAAGRRKEALAALDQVRGDFCTRKLAYDAALATLEEAVILLEDGDFQRVRELAAEIYWVFAAQQIHQETLASLRLFFDAVRRDEATVAQARKVLAEVRNASRAPEFPG